MYWNARLSSALLPKIVIQCLLFFYTLNINIRLGNVIMWLSRCFMRVQPRKALSGFFERNKMKWSMKDIETKSQSTSAVSLVQHFANVESDSFYSFLFFLLKFYGRTFYLPVFDAFTFTAARFDLLFLFTHSKAHTGSFSNHSHSLKYLCNGSPFIFMFKMTFLNFINCSCSSVSKNSFRLSRF